MKAKGLVAEIQRIINVKDSFTRMKQAREYEAEAAKAERERHRQAELATIKLRQDRIADARTSLFALFTEADPYKRGKGLEVTLNSLFEAYGILVAADFRRVSEGGVPLEQVDGVIEINNEIYLVEMKWLATKIGPADVSSHINRIMLRTGVSGIFISNSEYTEAVIYACRNFLQHRLMILCTLQEIVNLLEREADLVDFIKAKVRAAKLQKELFVQILSD